MSYFHHLFRIFKSSPLQGKVFYILIFFGAIISLVSSISNMILGLHYMTIITTLLLFFFCLGVLLVTSKTESYIKSAFITFVFLITIIYPLMWFYNGGAFGPTLFLLIFTIILMAILFDRRKLIFLNSLLLVCLLVLVVLEVKFPHWVVEYDSIRTHIIDLAIGSISVTLTTFMIIRRLMREYNERINELHETQDKLRKLTITDELTGIFNRRHIIQEINTKLDQDDLLPFSLIMLDIDDFKTINDQYGHTIGDEVIRGVGKFLEDSVRTIDVVGRIGGEEFMVILVDTTTECAKERADFIRREIANLKWSVPDLKVTISGGLYTRGGHDDLEKLLEKVDHYLYKAKERGKNRIVSS